MTLAAVRGIVPPPASPAVPAAARSGGHGFSRLLGDPIPRDRDEAYQAERFAAASLIKIGSDAGRSPTAPVQDEDALPHHSVVDLAVDDRPAGPPVADPAPTSRSWTAAGASPGRAADSAGAASTRSDPPRCLASALDAPAGRAPGFTLATTAPNPPPFGVDGSAARDRSAAATPLLRKAPPARPPGINVHVAQDQGALLVGITGLLFDARSLPQLRHRIDDVLSGYATAGARVTLNGETLMIIQPPKGSHHGG